MQANLIQSMQDYYRLRAPEYDQSMGYDQSHVIDKLQPVIAYMQETLRDLSVLEIACGPCFWTQYVAQSARNVVATDVNESVLREARKKQLDWQNIILMLADAYKLPVFPHYFDAIYAVDAFCHVPISKRKAFLDGLHSQLQSPGIVLFCDQFPGGKSLTEQFDSEGNHIQVRKLSDGSHHQVIKNYPDEDEIRTIFKDYSQSLVIEKFEAAGRYIISYRH
jgi:2-polyprenyl-3-methyl-5-hydroxy-6-metoxy-1,4-benzoquinol methylase